MEPTLKVKIYDMPDGKDYQVVKFNGEFDKAGHADVRDDLDKCVDSFEGKSLVFDFTELKFINSEGIGYLMETHTHLKKAKKGLVIVGANAHILDVFQAIGLEKLMPVKKTLTDFLNK